MRRIKAAAFMLCLVTMPLTGALGQSPVEKKPAVNQQSKTEAEQTQPIDPKKKVLAAIDEVLETQKSFADGCLRIVIQANIADIIWSYDERRARRLFEDSYAAIDSMIAPAQPSSAVPNSNQIARSWVIRLVMRHDAGLAARMIERVGDLSRWGLKLSNGSVYNERATLQLGLALSFVQSEPERAAEALRPLAEVGDLNRVLIALGMIRVKDPRTAGDLLLLALSKARPAQPRFEDVARWARYLFPSFGDGIINFGSGAETIDRYRSNLIDSVAIEQFLDMAYVGVTARLDLVEANPNPTRPTDSSWHDYAVAKIFVHYFERYRTDKAAAFRARVEESIRRIPPEAGQFLILTEPGTMHELLARAETASDESVKETLYKRAVFLAGYSNDFDQASAIIEKMSNDGDRSFASEFLRRTMDDKRSEEAQAALNKLDYDKAASLIALISDSQHFTNPLLLHQLIGQLARKDKPRAILLFNDYRRRAVNVQNRIQRALWLLQLSQLATSIDPERGLEEMNFAFAEFSQAGFVPEFEKYQEMAVAVDSANKMSRVNIGLSPLLNYSLSWWLWDVGFDRALLAAKQLEMKEASALVQLIICRGALARLPSAQPRPNPNEKRQ